MFEYLKEKSNIYWWEHLSEIEDLFIKATEEKITFPGWLVKNIYNIWEKGSEDLPTDYDDAERWSVTRSFVVQFGEKYYMFYWEEGLTEYQENEFWEQIPKEVVKVKRVVEIEEWQLVKSNNIN